LGELKTLGYINGTFWASEVYASDYAYYLNDGVVDRHDMNHDYSVVCVGN